MDRADTPPLGLGRWRRSKRAQAADSGLHSVHEDDRAEVHALVEGARSGDEAAFAALYDRFAPRVLRYAMSRCRSTEDAEDALADVFLAAWRALPGYQWTGAPFVTWLLGIASRVTASRVRDASRRVATVELDERTDAPAVAAPAHDERLCELGELQALLGQLPDDQRRVLELRFFADLSIEKTALAMKRSEGAVRQLQYRALERLRATEQEEAA